LYESSFFYGFVMKKKIFALCTLKMQKNLLKSLTKGKNNGIFFIVS